jgi:hypothetical protein
MAWWWWAAGRTRGNRLIGVERAWACGQCTGLVLSEVNKEMGDSYYCTATMESITARARRTHDGNRRLARNAWNLPVWQLPCWLPWKPFRVDPALGSITSLVTWMLIGYCSLFDLGLGAR